MHTGTMRRKRASGLTLIELLVVLFILGLLAALLLPAVQSARESARRATCQNNLRQLGLAANGLRNVYGHFPSGGIGWRYVADPNFGAGLDQPGGWVYSILPYMEQRELYDLGLGVAGPAKDEALLRRAEIPVVVFNCPSRRDAKVYPAFIHASPWNASAPKNAVKLDYAACAGDHAHMGYPGPVSPSEAKLAPRLWTGWRKELENDTGLCFIRSAVRIVPDGESQTYLFGEKYLNPEFYEGMDELGRTDCSDDQHAYSGFDFDNNRWTWNPNKLVTSFDCAIQVGAAKDASLVPMGDTKGYSDALRFGSAHSAGCYFVFCDGHVEFVSYTVDQIVHKQRGNRQDVNAMP